jgi:hypothetical protein
MCLATFSKAHIEKIDSGMFAYSILLVFIGTTLQCVIRGQKIVI